MSSDWQQQIDADRILLLDAAMGTELQRRGVPMDEVAWSGAAVLTHPDVVRATHADYIRAGARVIITNTFGSTRQMLEPAGYGDQIETVHRNAVKLAQQGREDAGTDGVTNAGSISSESPGFDRDAFLSPDKELASYRESVWLLADAGVDLIALEMIIETTHASFAMQAALETGLPVWLGVGCRKRDDGTIVSFDHSDIEFVTILDVLIPMGPSVVNIMHSPIDAIPEALELVQQRWDGPIGVYPESGVRLLGGCCGTGPEHIKALHEALPELEAMSAG